MRYFFEVGDAAETICCIIREANIEKAGILFRDKLMYITM
jgi:hypothetical protein